MVLENFPPHVQTCTQCGLYFCRKCLHGNKVCRKCNVFACPVMEKHRLEGLSSDDLWHSLYTTTPLYTTLPSTHHSPLHNTPLYTPLPQHTTPIYTTLPSTLTPIYTTQHSPLHSLPLHTTPLYIPLPSTHHSLYTPLPSTYHSPLHTTPSTHHSPLHTTPLYTPLPLHTTPLYISLPLPLPSRGGMWRVVCEGWRYVKGSTCM